MGVVVTEPGLDITFIGCRRARGDGAAGVRNLLLGGMVDWLWCRGDPFGTCRLDSQLRLFLTGSAAGPELERVRFGRLRRNFSTHMYTYTHTQAHSKDQRHRKYYAHSQVSAINL